MKCIISEWSCVYHACMSDDCQKKHVLKTSNWGKGKCEINRNNMDKKIGIGFGILSPSFAEQLKQQHFKFDHKKIKHFQKCNEYVTYLKFAGILMDSLAKKAQDRIFKKIVTHIRQENKLHEKNR